MGLEPVGGYQYANPRYELYPETGDNEFGVSFEFDQPDRDFTHLNQVPYYHGASSQPLDHEFDKYFELYNGEGEIKRGFFKTEQEVLFAPKKDRQPNHNNEYEHIYDQREIYGRVDPQNWHNFERPKGTRQFVGQGVDPVFRVDTFDQNKPYGYEKCPSYDWYRVPELSYEEYTNKTRPNFNVTKQVSSGVRPIFHTGSNMYMLTDLKNPTAYQYSDDMLLVTDGKYKQGKSIPDMKMRDETNRSEYEKNIYQQPIGCGTAGDNIKNIIFPKFRKSNRILIEGSSGNIIGADAGISGFDRDMAHKKSYLKSIREGLQNNNRGANPTSEYNFPTLPITSANMNDKNYMKYREHDLQNLAQTTRADGLMNKMYYSDPSQVPKQTNKETIINNNRGGMLDTIKQQQILNNPEALNSILKYQKRNDFVHNNYGGQLSTEIPNGLLNDENSIYLRDTNKYKNMLAMDGLGNYINSENSAIPIIDSNNPDIIRYTRKQGNPVSYDTQLSGNYTKNRLQNISEQRATRKENVAEFIPIAGSNSASDPHFYDPNTLTHNARKYDEGYIFTNSGAKQFGDNKNSYHNLKEEYVDYGELEKRNKTNPVSMNSNIPDFPYAESTRKSNKLPELNPRCISG